MRLEFLFSLPVSTTLASTALAQRPMVATPDPRYTFNPDAPTTWDGRLLTTSDGTPYTTEDDQIITLSPTAKYAPLDVANLTDDSPAPRRLGFYSCDCRETVSMWGDERIYQHTCEFEGYNYDDEPYVLETAIGMYLVGLEYVGKPTRPPSMAYLVPPKSHFLDRFQYQLTCSEIKLGSHFLSYLVRDIGQTNQVPCYFNHTHIPADSPTYTSVFWAMSDFMSGISGPQNIIDPNLYMTNFLKYMFGYPLEAWPFLVSAGNYIGGDPWDVNPVNHETPFLMNQFSEFRILNVGNLELPYGQAYLDKVSSVHGVSSYISSNIYYKSSGERAFKQSRRWTLDAPMDTVKVELVFFGLMTEQSKRLLPTHLLDTFDIRTDLEEEIAAIDHDCFVVKNTTYGTKCVLLVSGGFSPNYAHNPEEEIEANLTEFAKIVNTLSTFDGFIGSQTMVSGTVLLPNERWVMQGLPRGQLINRIGLTRAKRQDMYTAPTIRLSPIDGSEDIPEVPGTWPSDIEGAWDFLYVRQLDVAKRIVPLEEIGVFQGSIPLFKDMSSPRTSYTAESPIATAIADAIRTTSSADIAIVEGDIAAHGLYPPLTDDGDDSEEDPNMKETALTNRHLRELLHRNNSRSVVLKITPSQLFEVLNEQWQPETATTNLFRALAFSNMKAGFDAKRPMSSKVVYIEVNGERIDEDDEDTVFTLITTDYLRGGPMGHTVLRDLPDYSDESSESGNQSDGMEERKAVVVVGATAVDREEETSTSAADSGDAGILSGVKEAVKSNLRAMAKVAGVVPLLEEYSISDFDGLYIRDLFARHVANYPISEPLPRQENSTVVVPRDAAVEVSYPGKTPESPEIPFPVQLHFTAKEDKTIEGPFNVYRRDTSENLGQIAEISKEDPAVLVFDTYLSKLSQLVTVYVTHSRWEDQSYQRELAFAISLPGLSTGEESSDDDDSTSTVAPTEGRTASAGLNIALGLSCCISLMMSLII